MTTHKEELMMEVVNARKAMGEKSLNPIDEWGNADSEKYKKNFIELKENEVVSVRGERMINFTSCSYLGIHKMADIIESSKEALNAWGTGYSVSRSFNYMPFYTEVENILSSMYGNKHVYIGQSLSMCHLGFFSAKIKPTDVIVLEASAHASMRYASELCRAKKTKIISLSNWQNDEDSMNSVIEEMKNILNKYPESNIYFCADGVCSMRGTCIDPILVYNLTRLNKRVIAYIDDAHGMSLDGDMGQGIFYTAYKSLYGEMPDNLILTISLNKGWGSGGGALIMPFREDYMQLMTSPNSMMFSNQLQPSVMGANVAIAKFHASGKIVSLQNKLQENVEYFKTKLFKQFEKGTLNPLFLLSYNEKFKKKAPIFYFVVGNVEKLVEIVKSLSLHGILVGGVIYPVVPKNSCGFRTTILANHTFQQLDYFINSLVKIISKVYKPISKL